MTRTYGVRLYSREDFYRAVEEILDNFSSGWRSTGKDEVVTVSGSFSIVFNFFPIVGAVKDCSADLSKLTNGFTENCFDER